MATVVVAVAAVAVVEHAGIVSVVVDCRRYSVFVVVVDDVDAVVVVVLVVDTHHYY